MMHAGKTTYPDAGHVDPLPPMRGQTNTCENITLPETSFTGCKDLNNCKVIRVEYAYNHIQVRPVYNKQR